MTGAKWQEARIALYARYSSDNQRESSLEDQKRQAEQVAVAHGSQIDPNLVFMDSAMSGATLQRPEFQRMMQAVEEGQIDIVLTEDVSRVSRDLADAATVLKRLRHRKVTLVGIADGVNYSDDNSFMVYGMKAMMSQAYLVDLGYKTRRGLDGRMLARRSTGGRLFGYRSEQEQDSLGKPIGARLIVDASEAEVVRGIFEMSAAGYSLSSITRKLNLDGVPVLRPTRKNRKKGWIASTIRAILHNPTYIGQRSYGKRQWHRDPDTGKRRYRIRTSGVITQEQPELRIIDDALWQAVQHRLGAVRIKYAPKSDQPKAGGQPGRTTKYPFSGLLRCSCCDAPMVISGGTPHRHYRCGDVSKRGMCENLLSVQERHVRKALLDALQERVASPWAIAFIRKRWAEAVGEGARKAEEDLLKARARLNRCEQRLRNFADMWANGMRGTEVKDAWDDAKLEAQSVREGIKALEAGAHGPIQLPSPAEIEDRVLNLHRLAESSPVEAREALRNIFAGGRIEMIPQLDGSYIAKTEILPLVLIAPSKQNPRSGKPGEGLVYISGCAGRI